VLEAVHLQLEPKIWKPGPEPSEAIPHYKSQSAYDQLYLSLEQKHSSLCKDAEVEVLPRARGKGHPQTSRMKLAICYGHFEQGVLIGNRKRFSLLVIAKDLDISPSGQLNGPIMQ
jgi:hypothetical protein